MHIPSLLALPFLPLVLSAHLRFNIPAGAAISSSSLPPSTSATLTTLSTQYTASLRSDNSFDFRNVSTGSYLLDVHCHTWAFAPLRVDVTDGNVAGAAGEGVEAWGTFRGNEWGNKGEAAMVEREKEVWIFAVRALGGKEYLVQRVGFSPLGILKSPMILIAIASMGVVFGMPYLMDNMDPELKAEFQERQKGGGVGATAGVSKMQNFDAAAWLAGSTPKEVKKT